MDQISGALQALHEEDLREKREHRLRAKRVARHLRRTLVKAAGYAQAIDGTCFQRCIHIYLTYCKELRVMAPIVHVPRSIQHRFGRTIGGKPVSHWDTATVPNIISVYKAIAEKVGENGRTSETSGGE